jgi:hypothetical protein
VVMYSAECIVMTASAHDSLCSMSDGSDDNLMGCELESYWISNLGTVIKTAALI